MLSPYREDQDDAPLTLKVDRLSDWIARAWIPTRAPADWVIVRVTDECIDETALGKFDMELKDGYRYRGSTRIDCPIVVPVLEHDKTGRVLHRSGAYQYRFESETGAPPIEVLITSGFYSEQWGGSLISLGCMPREFLPVWAEFRVECERLSMAFEPEKEVYIIGGREGSFVPTVNWDDVILPAALKHDILHDVESFFTTGIDVYKRLNLKPFRKLLLTGVPGTGKTMICSAMAKWALERDYLVIYVSSARRFSEDQFGSSFNKIHRALDIATRSRQPALVLLEEMDAYLHEEEKSVVLNVLDGSESFDNARGTLLIATTNYPEAIDERVLKRPGRLDRIFIIPETRDNHDAERMLRQYLGVMWQDSHRALVPQFVGYPGAFIREVAVYALTQVAFANVPQLSAELLQESYDGLKRQIEAKDIFVNHRRRYDMWPFNLSMNGSPLEGDNNTGE